MPTNTSINDVYGGSDVNRRLDSMFKNLVDGDVVISSVSFESSSTKNEDSHLKQPTTSDRPASTASIPTINVKNSSMTSQSLISSRNSAPPHTVRSRSSLYSVRKVPEPELEPPKRVDPEVMKRRRVLRQRKLERLRVTAMLHDLKLEQEKIEKRVLNHVFSAQTSNREGRRRAQSANSLTRNLLYTGLDTQYSNSISNIIDGPDSNASAIAKLAKEVSSRESNHVSGGYSLGQPNLIHLPTYLKSESGEPLSIDYLPEAVRREIFKAGSMDAGLLVKELKSDVDAVVGRKGSSTDISSPKTTVLSSSSIELQSPLYRAVASEQTHWHGPVSSNAAILLAPTTFLNEGKEHSRSPSAPASVRSSSSNESSVLDGFRARRNAKNSDSALLFDKFTSFEEMHSKTEYSVHDLLDKAGLLSAESVSYRRLHVTQSDPQSTLDSSMGNSSSRNFAQDPTKYNNGVPWALPGPVVAPVALDVLDKISKNASEVMTSKLQRLRKEHEPSALVDSVKEEQEPSQPLKSEVVSTGDLLQQHRVAFEATMRLRGEQELRQKQSSAEFYRRAMNRNASGFQLAGSTAAIFHEPSQLRSSASNSSSSSTEEKEVSLFAQLALHPAVVVPLPPLDLPQLRLHSLEEVEYHRRRQRAREWEEAQARAQSAGKEQHIFSSVTANAVAYDLRSEGPSLSSGEESTAPRIPLRTVEELEAAERQHQLVLAVSSANEEMLRPQSLFSDILSVGSGSLEQLEAVLKSDWAPPTRKHFIAPPTGLDQLNETSKDSEGGSMEQKNTAPFIRSTVAEGSRLARSLPFDLESLSAAERRARCSSLSKNHESTPSGPNETKSSEVEGTQPDESVELLLVQPRLPWSFTQAKRFQGTTQQPASMKYSQVPHSLVANVDSHWRPTNDRLLSPAATRRQIVSALELTSPSASLPYGVAAAVDSIETGASTLRRSTLDLERREMLYLQSLDKKKDADEAKTIKGSRNGKVLANGGVNKIIPGKW